MSLFKEKKVVEKCKPELCGDLTESSDNVLQTVLDFFNACNEYGNLKRPLYFQDTTMNWAIIDTIQKELKRRRLIDERIELAAKKGKSK